MFQSESEPDVAAQPKETQAPPNKYANTLHTTPYDTNEVNYNTVEQLLEKEKQHNKSDSWNKLDKTVKIQKLHSFAEKYGKEHSLPVKEIKTLKMFFISSLEKNKLQKTKDVVYDKDSKDITAIPALHFNKEARNFTLRILDTKRVSTLKSLTPKRVTEKERPIPATTSDSAQEK